MLAARSLSRQRFFPRDFHNDSARRPCKLFVNAVSASSSDQSCLGPGFVSEVRSIVAASQVAFQEVLCPVSTRCTIWVSLKGAASAAPHTQKNMGFIAPEGQTIEAPIALRNYVTNFRDTTSTVLFFWSIRDIVITNNSLFYYVTCTHI